MEENDDNSQPEHSGLGLFSEGYIQEKISLEHLKVLMGTMWKLVLCLCNLRDYQWR